MKVSPPAPGRTRNALSVEDEWKVFLGAWKQAGHSIPTNSFQGPGRRLNLLQCLVADVFINRLDQVVTGDELFPPALVPAIAVFFSCPSSRSSDESQCRNAP